MAAARHLLAIDQGTTSSRAILFDRRGVPLATAQEEFPQITRTQAARAEGITVHEGGTYLCMEGPQFSTLAESQMYRGWGCDVIGMTNMPEDKLAREAELCYASVAMVTDYDCWHPGHGAVDVAQVIAVLTGNAARARGMVARLPALLGPDRAACPHGCDRALDFALMTAPERRDAALLAKLDAVAGRVLG